MLIIIFLNYQYSSSLRYSGLDERVQKLNRCFLSSFAGNEIKLVSQDGETTSMPYYLDMAIPGYCVILLGAFAFKKYKEEVKKLKDKFTPSIFKSSNDS